MGKKAAAGALNNLAYKNNANSAKIVKAGAVAPFLELLRCGDAVGKKVAAWALCSLLCNNAANQVADAAVNTMAVVVVVVALRVALRELKLF